MDFLQENASDYHDIDLHGIYDRAFHVSFLSQIDIGTWR